MNEKLRHPPQWASSEQPLVERLLASRNGEWKMKVRHIVPLLNNRALRDTLILNYPFSILNYCNR